MGCGGSGDSPETTIVTTNDKPGEGTAGESEASGTDTANEVTPKIMISINVRTMKSSAKRLEAFFKSKGVDVWICTNMTGGINFREGIVDAVKSCHVFVPLINNEWASSGECEDEFNLAKRLNLTSHERGLTQRTQPRMPVILPVAFPNLDWNKYSHVELLAASTNFIVHDRSSLLEGRQQETLNALLTSLMRALVALGIPVKLSTEDLASLGIECEQSGQASENRKDDPMDSMMNQAQSLSFHMHKAQSYFADWFQEMEQWKRKMKKFQSNTDEAGNNVYSLSDKYLGSSSLVLSRPGVSHTSWFSGELRCEVEEKKERTQQVKAEMVWTNLNQVHGWKPEDEAFKALDPEYQDFLKCIVLEVGNEYTAKCEGTFDTSTGVLHLKTVSSTNAIFVQPNSVLHLGVAKAGELTGFMHDGNETPVFYRGEPF